MEFEQMTLKDFAEWLRSQPADRMYNDGLRSERCPIAKYSGRWAAAYVDGMPGWASVFIDTFDDLVRKKGQFSSQSNALAALEKVEAMYGGTQS